MTDAGFPGAERFAGVHGQIGQGRAGARMQSTRDHDAIRRWAAAHQAEPATGQATASPWSSLRYRIVNNPAGH